MTQEEMMELYAILQGTPGKTAAQRLNLLQDSGFDPFNASQPYQRQQFQYEPEPVWSNPIKETYRNDPNYAEIFRLIDEENVAPEAAAQLVIDTGKLSKPATGDTGASDPRVVARMYFQEQIKNANERDNWYRSQEFAKQGFEAEQSQAEQQYESKRPYSTDDLFGVSQFEAMEAPTVEDLMATRADQLRQGRESLTASRMARPAPRSTSRQGSIVAAQGGPPRKDIMESPVLARAMRSTLNQRLDASKQRMLPTERSEGALRRLAIMQMLNQ